MQESSAFACDVKLDFCEREKRCDHFGAVESTLDAIEDNQTTDDTRERERERER